MGKKSVSSKAKKRQGGKAEASYKKYREQCLKDLEADLKKLSKMDFADFKKQVVVHIKDMYEMVLEALEFFIDHNAKKLNEYIDVTAKSLHDRDDLLSEAFKIRDERLDSLDALVFMDAIKLLSHLEDGPIPYEKKKDLSEFLGYDFDKTCENFRASKKTPS